MTIIITILVVLSLAATQYFLSKRKNFILGLIIPALIVVGSILFLIYIAKPGTIGFWIFRFLLLLGVSLEIYSEGRKKIKEKNKKELDKMTIQDL